MANYTIINNVEETTIISSSTQGVPGPPGQSSSLILSANTDIGGQRVVALLDNTVVYASNEDTSTLNKVIGISTQAVTAGTPLEIRFSGELDGFSGLVPNSVYYLSTNGNITDAVPNTGYVQQIGVARTATKLLINIHMPIAR